jgi:PST family polysaccharide transporter
MLGTFGGRIISLISLAVLARLLAPGDFGLLAFALVFITYLETVGDLGTSAALVYWPERWRDVAQLTFLANVSMGLLWVGVSLATAPLVASFFGSPEGAPVLRALCWVVLIKSLGNTHDALLQRDLRFRARMLPEIALLAVKAMASVGFALAGFGVWSLVWGQLMGQAMATGLLWILVSWRPGSSLPLHAMGRVLRYGRGIVSVNVVAAVVHHVDYVIVGRMLGVVTLGFYQMAYKVPDMVVTLLVRVASKVLFPALSRLRDAGGELQELFFPALRFLALIALPATLGIAFLAEPIILTLFGEPWQESVPILRAIAVYSGIRALGSFTGDVLKAMGRPGLLAGLGLARAAILVPALVMAALQGALAIAWTLTAVAVLSTCVNLALACHVLRSPIRSLVRSVMPGVAPSMPLLGFLLLWAELSRGLPPALDLILGMALGLGLFGISIRLLQPDIYRTVMGQLRPAPRKKASPEAAGPAMEAVS